MNSFEQNYVKLVKRIITNGEYRKTRNGMTRALFAETLVIPLDGINNFPLLQGRKIFYKGVLGELAAMLRKPTHIRDFEKWGCNYWRSWAKEDGSISIDYGKAWHADGQIKRLKEVLANNQTDRRMIISGWRPDNLDNLDLPCCHLLYQFYVSADQYLDMLWVQRSADTMIGIPSDIILASAWLIAIANEFSLIPGRITMVFGDTHIYEQHIDGAKEYVKRPPIHSKPKYGLRVPPKTDFCLFEPDWIEIQGYVHHPKIDFELIV